MSNNICHSCGYEWEHEENRSHSCSEFLEKKPCYSGKKSEKFWQLVNSLPECERNEMYLAGVLLQDMEGKILKILYEYVDSN